MSVVVFLGPTLPVERARQILPRAEYLPPAGQGDLLTALRVHRPHTVGLVDGFFMQTLSVWHKEILFALSEGVRVVGSSSMGALRAAECAPFGMVGVGRIYEQYRSGELTDDDEVAVAHAGPDDGWRPVSIPMVNVRATLAAAVSAGVCEQAEAGELLRGAKATDFAERSWRGLLDATHATAEVRSWIDSHAVDQKRIDAEELLRVVGTDPDPPTRPPDRSWTLEVSQQFQILAERDRKLACEPGSATLDEVARYALLHHRDGAGLAERAQDRHLLVELLEDVGFTVDESDITAEMHRFRRRRGLQDDADLQRYMDRNDLEHHELEALVRGLALARAGRRWLAARRAGRGLAKPVLDQLRLDDAFDGWATRALAFGRDHASSFVAEDTVGDTQPVDALVLDHVRATGWHPDTDIDVWADELGFDGAADLRLELVRARQVREVREVRRERSGGSVDGA